MSRSRSRDRVKQSQCDISSSAPRRGGSHSPPVLPNSGGMSARRFPRRQGSPIARRGVVGVTGSSNDARDSGMYGGTPIERCSSPRYASSRVGLREIASRGGVLSSGRTRQRYMPAQRASLSPVGGFRARDAVLYDSRARGSPSAESSRGSAPTSPSRSLGPHSQYRQVGGRFGSRDGYGGVGDGNTAHGGEGRRSVGGYAAAAAGNQRIHVGRRGGLADFTHLDGGSPINYHHSSRNYAVADAGPVRVDSARRQSSGWYHRGEDYHSGGSGGSSGRNSRHVGSGIHRVVSPTHHPMQRSSLMPTQPTNRREFGTESLVNSRLRDFETRLQELASDNHVLRAVILDQSTRLWKFGQILSRRGVEFALDFKELSHEADVTASKPQTLVLSTSSENTIPCPKSSDDGKIEVATTEGEATVADEEMLQLHKNNGNETGSDINSLNEDGVDYDDDQNESCADSRQTTVKEDDEHGRRQDAEMRQTRNDNEIPQFDLLDPNPQLDLLDPMCVWVNPHSNAHRHEFRTISQALQAAPSGSTLLLREGLYIESLVVSKAVRIIGIGSDVQLRSDRGNGITVKAEGVVIQNLHVRCEYNDISLINAINSDENTGRALHGGGMLPAFGNHCVVIYAKVFELDGCDLITDRGHCLHCDPYPSRAMERRGLKGEMSSGEGDSECRVMARNAVDAVDDEDTVRTVDGDGVVKNEIEIVAEGDGETEGTDVKSMLLKEDNISADTATAADVTDNEPISQLEDGITSDCSDVIEVECVDSEGFGEDSTLRASDATATIAAEPDSDRDLRNKFESTEEASDVIVTDDAAVTGASSDDGHHRLTCVLKGAGLEDESLGRITCRNSRIHHASSCGVFVTGRCRIFIDSTLIEGCGMAGVEVRDRAAVSVSKSRITACTKSGIFAHGGASVKISSTDVINCGMAGVEVSKQARGTIQSSRVYQGMKGGLFVHDHAQLVVSDSEIFANSMSNVDVRSRGKVEVTRCKISESRTSGVYVSAQGEATLKDNWICRNSGNGVELNVAALTCVGNQMHENKRCGIFANGECSGFIDKNDLRWNGDRSLHSHPRGRAPDEGSDNKIDFGGGGGGPRS